MTRPTRAQVLFWSAMSGVLWVLSWPGTGGVFPLAFIAWWPMLQAERAHDARTSGRRRSFTPYLLLGLFIWNASTTWWLGDVDEPWATRLLSGGFPMVGNTLLMSLPWILRRWVVRRLGRAWSDVTLVLAWLAFERLHHDWDLQWPWLTLGNVFAEHPGWIQWYEWTGVLGGSLWIWATALLIDRAWSLPGPGGSISTRSSRRYFAVAILGVPSLLSLVLYAAWDDQGQQLDVVVVQPNIDPYQEKFGGVEPLEQLEGMLAQAEAVMSDSTRLIVLPETALQENATVSGAQDGQLRLRGLWENDLEASRSVRRIREFLDRHPRASLLAGMSSAYLFAPGEPLTSTARRLGGSDRHYEAYNAALFVERDRPVQVYHKSKLVAGVEKLPFESLLGSLEYLSIDMGGTTGSLGVQQERSVLRSADGRVAVAPVICYESVFGDHVAPHVRNGATMIAIMTNDGWWGQSPGYRQHLAYGRLRAVETRRAIARSANTGISCVIDQRGTVWQSTEWWHEAAFRSELHTSHELTVFVRYGDLIGRLALLLLPLLLVAAFVAGRTVP